MALTNSRMTPTEAERIAAILYYLQQGIITNLLNGDHTRSHAEYHAVLQARRDEAAADIAEVVAVTERAYGGCRKCYGKGYASFRHGETYRGATHNMRNDMKFCTCDRGKQLEQYVSALRKPDGGEGQS